MALAISVAGQTGHEFVGTSSQQFGVLNAFIGDTPIRLVHRTSVQASMNNVRFTDLFLSFISHEVRSSRCSVPAFCSLRVVVCRKCRHSDCSAMAKVPSRLLKAPMHLPISVALGRTSAAEVLGTRDCPHARIIAFR